MRERPKHQGIPQSSLRWGTAADHALEHAHSMNLPCPRPITSVVLPLALVWAAWGGPPARRPPRDPEWRRLHYLDSAPAIPSQAEGQPKSILHLSPAVFHSFGPEYSLQALHFANQGRTVWRCIAEAAIYCCMVLLVFKTPAKREASMTYG